MSTITEDRDRRNRARSFRVDERLEQLARLQKTNRATFDQQVTAKDRISLGLYAAQKAAHAATQEGTNQ